MRRELTPTERAAALRASRGSLEERHAFARKFVPKVKGARDGWVWGRQTFDLKFGQLDAMPARVAVFCQLEAIEYIAKKKDADGIARRATYRHEHDKPYARIVTLPAEAPQGCPVITAKRGPSFVGPALFVLGELVAVEGSDESGQVVRWSAPRGCLLVGCPTTHDMHVIRQGAARSSAPPVWILRSGSPYRLTDRGIVR